LVVAPAGMVVWMPLASIVMISLQPDAFVGKPVAANVEQDAVAALAEGTIAPPALNAAAATPVNSSFLI
jgi:hypothetical protein